MQQDHKSLAHLLCIVISWGFALYVDQRRDFLDSIAFIYWKVIIYCGFAVHRYIASAAIDKAFIVYLPDIPYDL